MKIFSTRVGIISIIFLIPLRFASAAWEYPGCDPVSGANFRVVPICTKTQHSPLHEPLKMGFYQDDNDNVNIFIILRAVFG